MPAYRETKSEIFNIPPCLIKPNSGLSRTEFSDTALAGLADSIRRYGILQPLVVQLSKKGRYELVAGERRLRAALLLSMPTVPCVIMDDCDSCDYLSVVENIQREKLGMFDEARAIKRLYEKHGSNASETAKLLSVSEGELCRWLRLCEFTRAEMQAMTRLGTDRNEALFYLDIPHTLRYYTIKLCAEKGYGKSEIQKLCRAIAEKNGLTPDDLEEFAEKTLCHEDIKKQEHTEKSTPPSSQQRKTIFLRDLRAFEISLSKTCANLEKAGFTASISTAYDGSKTIYTISCEPKMKKG